MQISQIKFLKNNNKNIYIFEWKSMILKIYNNNGFLLLYNYHCKYNLNLQSFLKLLSLFENFIYWNLNYLKIKLIIKIKLKLI